MMTKGKTKRSNVMESVRIAVVQFPFIPVIKYSNDDYSFEEPDGKINFWLIGEQIQKKFPSFSSLNLEQIPDERIRAIKDYLAEDYQDWLRYVVKEILDVLVKTQNVDIILFPEYSLPIEIDSKLRKILKSYSEGRYIVSGVGCVCNGNRKRKNRFMVCNNMKIAYGEKVEPNEFEKEEGIIGGHGPLFFETQLGQSKEGKIYASIPMCSDTIAKAEDGSPVQEQMIREIKSKKIDRENIKISLIPSFSPNIIDMNNISETSALRFYKIVAFANCSFFGGSCIWYPPLAKGESISTQKINKGESACVVSEIPIKFLGEPTSTPVGRRRGLKPIPITNKIPIVFKEGSEGIKVNTGNFFTLINRRLDKAISLSGIAFARSPPNSIATKNIIKCSNDWKGLHKKISDFIGNGSLSYTALQSSDIIAFYELAGAENLYILMLDRLEHYMEDRGKRRMVREIRKYIIDSKWLPGPELWLDRPRSRR